MNTLIIYNTLRLNAVLFKKLYSFSSNISTTKSSEQLGAIMKIRCTLIELLSIHQETRQ